MNRLGAAALATSLGGLAGGGQVLAAELTPDEALARAIKRSPDLRAALAELEAARLGVVSADRAREWVLRASLQGQYAESFTDTGEGGTLTSNQTVSGDVSVTKTTDIGTVITVGAGASSRWQRVNRDVGTTEQVVIGPSVTPDLSLDVNQPLLRGGGTDTVLAPLRQARLQEQIARLQRDQDASQIARDALTAYWNLWVSERSLAVERASMEVTTRQLDDMKKKLALGTVPETDVLRLASQEASSRQNLVLAEAEVAQRQFELARLVGVSLIDAKTLTANGTPSALGATGTLEELVAVAQSSSYDLLQLELSVDQSKERVRVAADKAQPKLDLFGSLGVSGLWSPDANDDLTFAGDRPAFVALVGLDFELPLGDSSADADYAAARADQRAAELRYQARAEVIAADTATLYRQLETSQQAAKTAAETASIAARLADKEDKRLGLGTALVSEVISAQQALREAELTRLRAEADVALAALSLDHATGQLLTRLALTLPTENDR